MRRLVIILVVVSALICLVFLFTKSTSNKIEEPRVHYHAGFQVYKDNVLQDYSGLEYMNLKPCSESHDHTKLSPEDLQLEKAHLHDNVGNVVHVHTEGALWGDLFKNISVDISPDTAYVNGKQLNENIMVYPIKPYDSVVIFIGENTQVDEKILGMVTQDQILEAENKSESCGS